jgi:hypothetical protein
LRPALLQPEARYYAFIPEVYRATYLLLEILLFFKVFNRDLIRKAEV